MRFDQQTVIRGAWWQFGYILGGFQQRLHFGGKAQRPVVCLAMVQWRDTERVTDQRQLAAHHLRTCQSLIAAAITDHVASRRVCFHRWR